MQATPTSSVNMTKSLFKQGHIFVRAQMRGPLMQLALGSVLAAFVRRAQAICKSVPGPPGWLSPSEWASFNQSVSEVLLPNLLHQVAFAIMKYQTTTRRYVQPSKSPDDFLVISRRQPHQQCIQQVEPRQLSFLPAIPLQW
jgi:hypothetical protein